MVHRAGFVGRMGPPYTSMLPEALALFARMTVQPSDARKAVYNNLITSLIQGGVWSKRECIYLEAAHDAQAGRLNLKSAAYDLTAVNSPAFTTDRGYTGDGVTSYLNTGFLQTALDQNNAGFSYWMLNSIITGFRVDMGTAYFNSIAKLAGTNAPFTKSANITGQNGSAVATSAGITQVERVGSTGYKIYKDGAVNATIVQTSSTPDFAAAFFICAQNGNIAPSTFSQGQFAYTSIGQGLTDAEAETEKAAAQTYLQAVGAI